MPSKRHAAPTSRPVSASSSGGGRRLRGAASPAPSSSSKSTVIPQIIKSNRSSNNRRLHPLSQSQEEKARKNLRKTAKRSGGSSVTLRIQRQREAVRRFRQREKERLNNTLRGLALMRRELTLLNTAIDKVDEDIDLMKELIEIQKGRQLQRRLEARLASSQASQERITNSPPASSCSGSQADPSSSQDRDLMEQEEGETETAVDLTDWLSSPSDLQKMVDMVRHDSGSGSQSQR